MAAVESRERRVWRRWLIATMVLLVVMGGAGLVTLRWFRDDNIRFATIEDVVTEHTQMSRTALRLGAVGQVLRSLPALPDATAEPVRLSGCTVDSGDLFQPRVNLPWRVQPGSEEQVGRAVRTELTNRGWTVGAAPGPASDARITFASPDGWTSIGVMYTIEEEHVVAVEMTILGAEPCEFRPGARVKGLSSRRSVRPPS